MNHILGAHTSIAGGFDKAVALASKLNFNAMQIFSKNNNQWAAKPITPNMADLFRNTLAQSEIAFVVVHDSYLINLCAIKPELLERSREAFIEELQRCEILGIPYLNFHPGTHGGQGETDGIKIIAESINIAHEKTKGFQVGSMLEMTAGQGTSIGHRFEHIRGIIDLVEEKERMSVCIDTAHIFAAGYDIKTPEGYKQTFKEFDDVIGLNKLKCFHINDSKKELGSRVDRHEHIGKGYIGEDGFANLMNDESLVHVPKILETPKGKDQKEDLVNIAALKKLIRK